MDRSIFKRKVRPFRRSRRRGARLRARTLKTGGLVRGARSRLQGLRQATILAVALTGFLLLLFDSGDQGMVAATEQGAQQTQEQTGGAAEPGQEVSKKGEIPDTAKESEPLPQAASEINSTLRSIKQGFLVNLPKFLAAAGILAAAWLLSRLLRLLITRLSSRWERGNAASVLVMILFWLLALGIAISILVGDLRALAGSLGLVGLALSWALQTPIESFTGWLLNSFKGYYRIGDRIAVGDIFGDVYRIDVLTTMVWEIGGPDRPLSQVQAEQPTGRLITFPNNEILTGSVVNLTRDFPYVWDELNVQVANESDLSYAAGVLENIAVNLLGKEMQEPALRYQTILRTADLASSVPDRPQLFFSLDDSWVNITIRYLTAAHERRIWKSELTRSVMKEINSPEHAGRIIPVYQRRQVQFIDEAGRPQVSR